MESIGFRIRTEREAQGIDRGDLAKATGLAKTTLSDLEIGRSRSTTALHKIAKELRVRAEWLETGRGPKQAESGPSQPSGLSPQKIVSTTKALLTFLRRRDPGATLDLTNPEDAELFAGVYAEAIALPARPSEDEQTEFAAKVADLIAARERRNERARSQSVGSDSGKQVRSAVSGKKA